MTPALILPFHDTLPGIGPLRFAGAGSAVLGRATVGAGAWLGPDSVIRADGETVTAGGNLHLGPRATVHIVHDKLATALGRDVTVGAFAVVHACRIGDGCVIEHDVTVLDGAVVGPGVLVEAGSTVFPRKTLDAGWVYAGSPAKPVRALRPGELDACAAAVRARDAAAAGEAAAPAPLQPPECGGDAAAFVAVTAAVKGHVRLAPGAGLFFSCVADAGTGSIAVGAGTNVQDNALIRAGAGEAVIGRATTVGHNAVIGAARIGDHGLVGMGARIADGVVVGDDVLVAAGTTTEPGQVLEGGWLWGGRPARPLSRLGDAQRDGMRANLEHYDGYMAAFARLQRERARRG